MKLLALITLLLSANTWSYSLVLRNTGDYANSLYRDEAPKKDFHFIAFQVFSENDRLPAESFSQSMRLYSQTEMLEDIARCVFHRYGARGSHISPLQQEKIANKFLLHLKRLQVRSEAPLRVFRFDEMLVSRAVENSPCSLYIIYEGRKSIQMSSHSNPLD